MMILSRIWYVILALLVAAAYYIVSLAVGQYNRRNQAAMDETLKADSQVVSTALQVDARRRLDALLLASVDGGVVKSLKAGNAARETIPASARDEGAKALRAFNEKLPAEYKNDILMTADREGRLVSQIGYDAVAGVAEFEIGGYPAVFDALHGFLRDDTWVLGGRIARVVTRPVQEEAGQPPLGAVVGVRWVDASFAKEMARRTRTNIAFFALGQRVASAATIDGFEENALEALGADLEAVSEDKQFRETGRTDVRPLGSGEKGGVLFARLAGEAWELDAGFAVARQKVAIDSPLGFISGADDQDKRNVKLGVVIGLAVGLAFLGLLFSWLEHSRPLRELADQAAKLKRGDIDVFQLPRFRGGYRPIATDVNAGIQRVIEKGGGTARKPADLESILGPVPAQPNMSAFSFPMADGPAPPSTAAPNVALPPPSSPLAGPGSGPRLPPPSRPNAPPAVPSRPGAPAPVPLSAPAAPAPPPPAPAPMAPPPMAAGAQSATVAASPTAQKLGGGPPNLAPRSKEEEETMVAAPAADLVAAAGGVDGAVEWQGVYEEFLRTKRECGEPTEGLTFEKFQQTLKKNRDALMQRHGCKRVKFSVYVKEGRASLKATPVRD